MSLDHRQIEREAAAWLARRDAGGWAPVHQTDLDHWLQANLAHRVAYLRLQAAWDESARLKALAAGGRDSIPARGVWAQSPYFTGPGDGRYHRYARKRRLGPWIGLAASLLMALALVGGLAWQALTRVDRASWTTALGGQQVVQLADGSTATLGGASELQTAFSRRVRNLDLVHGEAFFDVAHDSARPFVVHAAGYRVVAVGTRFDVRRDGPGRLRVVVTRGLVRLQPAKDSGQPASMLPAGSIALVAGGEVTIAHVPLAEARERLSWRDGYAVFHGTPLAEAVQEFNRYSSRPIVLADPALGALRVGGNFRLDNSAAFVRLMQQVFPLQAVQQADRIVLSRRKGAESAR